MRVLQSWQAGTTLPRTEQRFTPDYTNGEIQYQATMMVPSNETAYCIFQIHSGDAQSTQYGSTTFMLFWYSSNGGSVHDYSGTELSNHLAGQWFQVNVDHNLVTRTIKVWINGEMFPASQAKVSIADRGYVLSTGRLVLEGKAADLLQDEGLRKAYLGR